MSDRRFKILGIFWIALVFLALGIWTFLFSIEPRATLSFQAFNIGQGDALFIETPDRYHILIDGGPDATIIAKLGESLSFWNKKIDLIILTHPHADHVSGLVEVLKRYQVGAIIESNARYNTAEYTEWNRMKEAARVPSYTAVAGMRAEVGKYIVLQILTPFANDAGQTFRNIHDSNIVSRFTYGREMFLLMGDAEESMEQALLARGVLGPAAVLKVGHHGSQTSTSQGFLDLVHPAAAVISVGEKNTYGHPRQEVLDRLSAIGAKVFRTDQDGDVRLTTDGLSIVESR
ncbi:MAG: hypothetical protein A3C11_01970 [Candidatus Sungbacteria bacterium RIFCSPHIGHO2_02_FULL_49_12]|uniref:Metallo-beta-lactamase domain-containing protein n=1 Tax=Candidatus Sungbacteria bacterium RIFCSPHIGHO2_02_FULL_49_12 TaxID=1802271 RepID=A0A1G2KP15_9BACT|nr:MAG: hypothetical protein A3C11_01970 [Candidatus Sungbacteria bacterium RIFCSPHIGHO2_02_FULL_49_12]